MNRMSLLCFAVLGTPALADINPTNGTWFGKVLPFASSGCPQQVQQQMQMAGPQDTTFELVWDGTAPSFGDFQWVRTGENQFQATISEGQDTQMGSIRVRSVLNLTVLSEVAMSQTGQTTVAVTGQLAEQMGSMENCVMTHGVEYNLQN